METGNLHGDVESSLLGGKETGTPTTVQSEISN